MSNRLVKNGLSLVPQEELLLSLKVTRKGVELQSPLPPQEVCKLLHNIGIDLLYNSFVRVEPSKIEVPSNIIQ